MRTVASFADQPQVGLPGNNPTFVERTYKSGEDETYRIDARALAPPERTPQLQNDLHYVLKKNWPDLRDGRFAISRIEPLRDENGNVVAYQVQVRH